MKIGIDPGISGAIAILKEDFSLEGIADMPVMAGTGKRQQVNGAELAKMLYAYSILFEDESAAAYLEQSSAMPKQGVSSMFSFGTSYGIVMGVLCTLKIPFILVRPAQWKKRARLIGKDKDCSRTLAQQLYPQAELGRKRDIGRADAILIARFGS